MKWLIELLSSIILDLLKTPAKEIQIEKAGSDIDYKPDGLVDIDWMLDRCEGKS